MSRGIWLIFYLAIMLGIAALEVHLIFKNSWGQFLGLAVFVYWTLPLWWPGAIGTIKRWKAR